MPITHLLVQELLHLLGRLELIRTGDEPIVLGLRGQVKALAHVDELLVLWEVQCMDGRTVEEEEVQWLHLKELTYQLSPFQ